MSRPLQSCCDQNFNQITAGGDIPVTSPIIGPPYTAVGPFSGPPLFVPASRVQHIASLKLGTVTALISHTDDPLSFPGAAAIEIDVLFDDRTTGSFTDQQVVAIGRLGPAPLPPPGPPKPPPLPPG